MVSSEPVSEAPGLPTHQIEQNSRPVHLSEDVVFIVANSLALEDLRSFRLVCHDLTQKIEKAFHRRLMRLKFRVNKDDLSRLTKLSKTRLAGAIRELTLYGVSFNQLELRSCQNRMPTGHENDHNRTKVRLGQLERIRTECEAVDRATLGLLLTEAFNGLHELHCISFQDRFWDPFDDYECSIRPCNPGVRLPGWQFELVTNALAESINTVQRLVLSTELYPDSSWNRQGLSNIRRLSLICDEGSRSVQAFRNQSALISATPQLEYLKIKLRARNIIDAGLGSMIMNTFASEALQPHNLRTLELHGVHTKQKYLEHFLSRYRLSLRNITFNKMWLLEGKWCEVFKMIHDEFSLDTFHFTNIRGEYCQLLKYRWAEELTTHPVLVPAEEDDSKFFGEVVGCMGMTKALEVLIKVIGDM